MYKEIKKFSRAVLGKKGVWKDGDIWTAILGGGLAFYWVAHDCSAIPRIRHHFSDLLLVTSIVFGFALSAMIFYIQAAGSWSKDREVAAIAEKIVDWHVWTIVCLLFLIGYSIALWAFGNYLTKYVIIARLLYACLAFQFLYCGFQILNHSLTIWWSFKNRTRLMA